MKNLKILLPVLVLTGCVAGAWALLDAGPKVATQSASREPPLVDVMTAQPETLSMNVSSQGVVSPRAEIDLVTEVAGKVVAIHPAFAAGGFFKKGDRLVDIDPRDYDFAVVRARARVAEANKELLREQAEAEQAQREWQELGSGEASPYVLHQPQLAERRAKLAAAQADLDEARLKRARCVLWAPFDGRVRSKQVDIGQYVEAGDPLARVYATDVAEVRLPIAPDQLQFIDLPLHDAGGGDKTLPRPAVTLTARFGARQFSWQGRIVRTEGAVDEKSGMIYAVARVPEPYAHHSERPPLAVGQFVQAEIEGLPRDTLVKIPHSALHSGYQVYTVDGDDRLRLRTVEVLRREDDGIIVSGGLAAGERVMVAGVELPVAGMRVRSKPGGTPDLAEAKIGEPEQ